jgi:hypothetical protein
MSTLPPGERPPAYTRTGALCPDGTGPVSVTVSDCADGKNLGYVIPFSLSTDSGQFGTSVNGVCTIECAYVGFRFTVGLTNYYPQEFTINAADVQASHLHVCLNKKPPPPMPPPTCMVHSLTYTDEFEPSRRALEPYYRVRDLVASTPRGAKLVDLYYEPETKKRTFDAVQNSAHLRAEGLALIIELQSVLRRLTEPGSRVPGACTECGCLESDPTEPLLPADVVRRASRFLDMLEEESKATDLTALTRELLAASEQGSQGVVLWLREEED